MMKRLLLLLAVSVCPVTVQSQIVFSDNFNSGVLDTAKWRVSGNGLSYIFPDTTSYIGSYVKDSAGMLVIAQAATDNGGRIYSKPISIDTTKDIAIHCRTFVHWSNQYFTGSFTLGTVNNITGRGAKGLWTLTHFNYSYTYTRYGFGLGGDTLLPQVANAWFTEDMVYSPKNKTLQYTINGTSTVTYTIPATMEGNRVCFCLDSYGWWTGHYTRYDSISVELKEPSAGTRMAAPHYVPANWKHSGILEVYKPNGVRVLERTCKAGATKAQVLNEATKTLAKGCYTYRFRGLDAGVEILGKLVK